MEAARILMAANVKPKRTIRFRLWSGEEQGLLGSKAYVLKHAKEVNETVSAVFVHDGGTNYCSGIICTPAITQSMRARGGSDHVSFIQAGVPGFFWKQAGRATYRTTHHTQFDTYDSVVPEYQEHSSLVIALGALGTANLDHLLSREGVQSPTLPSLQESK